MWSREIALVLGQKGMGARPLGTWRGRIRSFSRFKEEGASYVDRVMISHIAEDGILQLRHGEGTGETVDKSSSRTGWGILGAPQGSCLGSREGHSPSLHEAAL